MKKNIIFIITLLLVILTTNNVYAYKEGSLIGTNVAQAETMYSAWGINYYKHTATINGSSEFILCLQGGYAASNSKNLYVKMVLDDDKASERAYNAGVKAIFDKMNNTGKYENLNVVSAQQAARVFNLLWYHASISPKINPGNGKICNGQLCGHYKVTAAFYNKYLASSTLKEKMLSATGKKSLTKISGISTSMIDTATDSMVDKVKDYFKVALEAAIDARTNGTGTSGVTISKLSKQSTNEYTSTITFNNSNTKKSYLRLECDGCDNIINNSKVYAKTSKGSYQRITLGGTGNGTNLKGLLGSSNKLDIKIVLPATSSCDKLKITMKVTGETSDYAIYIAGDKTVGPSNGYQEFIVYIPDTSGVSKTTTISPCKGCEDYYNACQNSGNANSYACQEYKKKYNKSYGETCTECTTKVDNKECSTSDQTFSITEGVEVSNTSCGTKNIKGCIIGQSDESGNSYEAKTSGYPSADNNPYCKVYCTEDYTFDMPGVTTTTSGRYIKDLTTTIKGTKSCYTSEINTTQFESDLEAARIEMQDAFTVWSIYYQIINTPFTTYSESESYSVGCHYGSCTPPEGSTSCTPPCNSSSRTCTKTVAKKNVTYLDGYGKYHTIDPFETELYYINGYGQKVSLNNRCSYQGCLKYGRVKTSSCSCSGRGGSCGVYDYTDDFNSRGYTALLKQAANALNTKIANYNKILKQYNSCSSTISNQDSKLPKSTSTIWKMNYNFNPTVNFWYEDTYMNIAEEKTLIGSGSSYGLNIQICNGDVDNYYGCSSSWLSNTSSYTTQNLVACYSTSGGKYACSSVPTKIATAKYVKQSMSASGTYRLPSQYYIVYPGGKTVTKKTSGASLLENKLPVSLNVASGTYTYTLSVDGLGEYYTKGTTGRIWGADDSVVATSVDNDNACTTEGAITSDTHDSGTKGEYSCAYKVNCPDCPVTCVGDNCSYKCDNNGCKATCEKCVFKLGTQNFTYRQISTDDINPNNRNLGANWSYDSNITTKTEMKACVATNEILANGETVYDTESDSNDSKVLKVKLTQSMINSIKDYNKDKEDDGGFGDNSLECYPYTDSTGTYESIFCYSEFLDKYSKEYSDNFKFYKNRLSKGNAREKTKNQCSGKNCYWTTWNEALNNSISVTTNKCRYSLGSFAGIVDDDNGNAIGPSYR